MNPMNDMLARLMRPALIGAVTILAAAAAVSVVSAVAHMTRDIGDMVVFDATSPAQDDDESRMAVHRVEQFGCVLDIGVIRRTGGSLVVEGRLPGESGAFRVHWAGERTSADSGDCGTGADLLLDAHDLDKLALAAGGYGVGPKRTATYQAAPGN